MRPSRLTGQCFPLRLAALVGLPAHYRVGKGSQPRLGMAVRFRPRKTLVLNVGLDGVVSL